MKKLIISLFIFHFSFFTLLAQTWDSVGSGLGSPCGGYSFSVNALAVYNGNVYEGGSLMEPTKGMGYWNGTQWDSLSTGLSGCGGGVYALAVYNGKLYAAGIFPDMGNIITNNIACWDGSNWQTLGLGMGIRSWVRAMCVYNGKLYVAGLFDSAGGAPAVNIACWDGTSWSAVGGGVGYYDYYNEKSAVYCMYVYNNKLYVGGKFDSAGGHPAKYVATWDGSSWSPLSNGPNLKVTAIGSFNNDLYFEGLFDSAGGVRANGIVKLSGAIWSPLGAGLAGMDKRGLYSLTNYNNKLIAGGAFDSAGGMLVHGIAEWDGSNWAAMGQGLAMMPHWIDTAGAYATLVFNNTLYVAGVFETAGNINTNNIASWTEPLGVNEIVNKQAEVSLYPNPNNGAFTLQIKSEQLKVNSIIEIYNMLGEKALTLPLSRAGEGITQINMGHCAPGIYLYKVIDENAIQIATGKFVIE